ncbi:uncharacterized protein LOC108024023 isoform X1 [Drosophila biarmipes]|uniref:uncharacterized protein LOC108024023 isoform X1 n=1 Tax=Drosophila biarmipes TaxID=125945 RepID=UPI0007E897F7|nr:uncharacterized protein LOC108024023 isoform X1 [Drosophila biarmipes]
MCHGVGLCCGLLSLGAFISCFVALHMLNKIIHIQLDAVVHMHIQLKAEEESGVRCQRTLIVDNLDAPHLSWLELFYMRWTLVFTLFYSFAATLLIRAKYLGNFDISRATSKAVVDFRFTQNPWVNTIFSPHQMILMGSLLSMVLLLATVVLHQREPFLDLWCNMFIVYHLYYIVLTTAMSVVFFLAHSCRDCPEPALKF